MMCCWCQGLAEEKLYNNLDVTVATALKSRREVTTSVLLLTVCFSFFLSFFFLTLYPSTVYAIYKRKLMIMFQVKAF